jgi:hypothetical protein
MNTKILILYLTIKRKKRDFNMKKTSYALIGTLLISMMFISPVTFGQGTTYTCTGVVGAEAVWSVKTVHPGALSEIFGASPMWEAALIASFGLGSDSVDARMKSKVTHVTPSETLGLFEVCNITSDLWIWTTKPFGNTPNYTGVPTFIMMHPENLTYYCQLSSGFTQNVSVPMAYPFLNAIPVPAATYLSELVWDNDYAISGTTVTHNLVAPYSSFFATYLVDCTEIWRYSSSYGTFLGYKLVHNNGTTAYETVLESGQAPIPGYELPIVLGVSMAMIVSLIYVIMKKKR